MEIVTRDISIWLDEYDDIFSDFDSRPYTDRVLSDDFIGELNKVSMENDLKINELRLLLPNSARNKETEGIITKRLHSYFRNGLNRLTSQKRKTVINNLFMLVAGIIMMTLATYVSSYRHENIWWNILFVILEPGGWFIVWTSLDRIFNFLGKNKAKINFYSEIGRSKIQFVSIK